MVLINWTGKKDFFLKPTWLSISNTQQLYWLVICIIVALVGLLKLCYYLVSYMVRVTHIHKKMHCNTIYLYGKYVGDKANFILI